MINESGSVKLMLTDGVYYVSKDYDEADVTMSEKQDDALTREELTTNLGEVEDDVTELKTKTTDLESSVNTINTKITTSETANAYKSFTLTPISNSYYKYSAYAGVYKNGYITINIPISVTTEASSYVDVATIPTEYATSGNFFIKL